MTWRRSMNGGLSPAEVRESMLARRTLSRLVLPLALVCIHAAPVTAQYPAVAPDMGSDARLDSDSPGTSASLMPQAVGTDDGTLHVIWQDQRGPTWGIYYRRIPGLDVSTAPTEVELSAFAPPASKILDHSQPSLASDGGQFLYVTWHTSDGGNERILFVRSGDGGLTWSAPTLAPNGQLNLAIMSEYAGPPRITADTGGHVQVAWAQSDGVFDQVYCVASSDWGVNFTVPVASDPVNLVLSGHSEGTRLASDGAGGVFVAWLDHRDPDYRDVYLRRSLDHGLTFEPAERRLSSHGTAHELELAVSPAVLLSGGLLMAAWIDIKAPVNNVPNTTVMSRYSLDGGQTFSLQPEQVSPGCAEVLFHGGNGSPGGSVGGLPGGGPAGSPPIGGPPISGTQGGATTVGSRTSVQAPCVAMFLDLDLTSDGQDGVWAAYSRIDAPMIDQPSQVRAVRFSGTLGRWEKEKRVSRGGAHFPDKGLLPTLPRANVAANGEDVYVAWMQSGGAYLDTTDIVVAWSRDGGGSWHDASGATTKAAGPGLSRSANPQLVAFAGQAVIVWDDRRSFSTHESLPLPPGAPVGSPDIYCNILTPQQP